MATNVEMLKSDYERIVAVYEYLKDHEILEDSDISDVLSPQLTVLKEVLDQADTDNSLTRYYLCIKWHDLSARPADYDDYPPVEEATLYSYTAFTKQFVEDFVEEQTARSANILVTDDPSGNVGWLELDVYFG